MARWLNNVEAVLRRYPWVIPLGALVPCAYFAARGTNDLVAARLFAADTEALARALPASAASLAPAEPVPDLHSRDRAGIVHRNAFDSDAGCLDCDAGPADAAVEPGAPAAPEPPSLPPEACDPAPPGDGQVRPGPCDTQAKIVGAVQSDDILWSFVLVQMAATGPAMPYRFGSTLDGRNVTIVSWCRALGAYVLLRPPGGQRCFLAQNMPPRAAPAAAPAAVATAAATPAEGGALGGVLEGIERVSNNEYNVRRSTVDRILESQAELMRTTRIMPVEQGGRVVGVQLFGVRGNSLLGRLGMQNGDVLNRINGLDIASPDRALEAYSRLRTSDSLQVSVTRGGQPVNIDFHIR